MLKENDRVKTLVEKEGFPAGTIGVVVSKGEIQYNNTGGYPGLYLIGLDNNNL